jgi:hypothetical protein
MFWPHYASRRFSISTLIVWIRSVELTANEGVLLYSAACFRKKIIPRDEQRLRGRVVSQLLLSLSFVTFAVLFAHVVLCNAYSVKRLWVGVTQRASLVLRGAQDEGRRWATVWNAFGV